MAEDKDSLDAGTDAGVEPVDITVDALGEEVVIPSFVVALSPVLQAALKKGWDHKEPMKLPYSASTIHEMISRYSPSIEDYLQLPGKDGDWFLSGSFLDESGRVVLVDADIKHTKMPYSPTGLRLLVRYRDVIGIMTYEPKKFEKRTEYEYVLRRGSIRTSIKSFVPGIPGTQKLVQYGLRAGLRALLEKSILGDE